MSLEEKEQYFVAVKIFLERDGEFFVCKDKYGSWDLPGGRIHKQETPYDALKREVHEETGIANLHNIEHFGTVLSDIRVPTYDAHTAGLIFSVYKCAVPENVAIILSPEHSNYEWATIAKTIELLRTHYPHTFLAMLKELQEEHEELE